MPSIYPIQKKSPSEDGESKDAERGITRLQATLTEYTGTIKITS